MHLAQVRTLRSRRSTPSNWSVQSTTVGGSIVQIPRPSAALHLRVFASSSRLPFPPRSALVSQWPPSSSSSRRLQEPPERPRVRLEWIPRGLRRHYPSPFRCQVMEARRTTQRRRHKEDMVQLRSIREWVPRGLRQRRPMLCHVQQVSLVPVLAHVRYQATQRRPTVQFDPRRKQLAHTTQRRRAALFRRHLPILRSSSRLQC